MLVYEALYDKFAELLEYQHVHETTNGPQR